MSKKILTIEFEDHGQDFLEWDISKTEAGDLFVSDSRPYQQSWIKTQIKFPGGSAKIGGEVMFRDGKHALTLKYKIKEIKKW